MRRVLALLALATVACKGKDADGDGFRAPEDCNDESAAINPDAAELCDAVDNNCDGNVDEGVTTPFFLDSDADGYGNPEIVLDACNQPDDYVENDEDCDDTNPEIRPGATEYCDQDIDYNCDGSVGYVDNDGDGVAACQDCDDNDATISPLQPEICDGIDNDCDQAIDIDADPTLAETWYFDGDQDGFGIEETDDGTPTTVRACDPPAGYTGTPGDCNDAEATAFPGGFETCDGLDNDCDGTVDGPDAEGAITVWPDVDGDGFGDVDGVPTADCDGFGGYVADNTDCDDTTDRVNPGEDEVCNDGFDNNCDGIPTDCSTTVAAADAALIGENQADYAGQSVLGSADLNNDGAADLFVGATQLDSTTANVGGVYVLYGPLSSGSSSLSTADATLVGPDSGSQTGNAAASIGDFDNDGVDDVALAARLANSTLLSSGKVFVLTGGSAPSGASNLNDAADYSITGSRGYAWLGTSLVGPGDINGDGIADLVVSGNGDDSNGQDSGTVWLIHGGSDLGSLPTSSDQADATWTGEGSSDLVGVLGGRGDLDGDGLADFGVGHSRGDAQGAFTGAVYLMSSADASGDTDLSAATARVDGASSGDFLGSAVVGAGDVNGDGLNDLWVGASRVDTTVDDAGAVYLIPGQSDLSAYDAAGIGAVATVTIYGSEEDDGLGTQVDGGVDFSGSSAPDLLIGVSSAGEFDVGAVYLFLDPASGTYAVDTDADATVTGNATDDRVGSVVAFGGDLLGTSGPTVLVGAWEQDTSATDAGGVYVFSSLGF